MFAVIWLHLVSLFSLRAVTTNAFTARTLLCPTPAALKLGLLSHLLERDAVGQEYQQAQEHLEWLAPLKVAWAPPPLLAVSAATMRVWKGDKADESLKSTVGLREYAHYDQPFGLALGPVPPERQADLAWALESLRALGVAESLVQPLAPPLWRDAPPAGFVWLTKGAEEGSGAMTQGEACMLDDLGSAPAFARLSVYRSNDKELVPRLGEDRRRVIVVLPLRQRRYSLNGRVLERMSPVGGGASS